MDDSQFYIRVFAIVAAGVISLIACITFYFSFQNYLLVSAIEKGTPPLLAKCALVGSADRTGECNPLYYSK